MQLGGLVCHLILLPIFVLAPLPPLLATIVLISGGCYRVLLAHVAIAGTCMSRPTFGGAGTITAGAITVGLITAAAGCHEVIASGIWLAVIWLNWGRAFAYSPAFTRFIFRMDMPSYYAKCELRGALHSLGRTRTLFMFHPHGMVTCGFSANGVWSREFNLRTMPLDANWEDAETWPGAVFLIASGLREASGLFKLLCDLSGRLESATRANIKRLMRAGRNVAIIPGGFEETTLYQHGVHRVAMRARKGVVKYALQHGYQLQPLYTFGETRTFYTAPKGLLAARLWLNRWQVPAVAYFGEPLCPIFPRRDSQCLTYVGEPLPLPQLAEPSAEQVDQWHAVYIEALQSLFEKSKEEAGEPKAILEVW